MIKHHHLLILPLAILVSFTTYNIYADTNTSAPLSGGDPIYMNYNNLAIPGDVTAVGHEKWIELNSFQWGVGRAISSSVGTADREASAPSISEIVITKVADKSSIPLIRESLVGRGVPVTIDFVQTTSTRNTVYLKYTLENVLVSKYSVSSGGDRPTESIALNFNKFTTTFFDPTFTLSSISICWDASQNKICVAPSLDTTPPVLSLPSDITQEETSPSGNVVSFTASANDDVDGSVPVTCTPASGSTFALGTTTVNCSAADHAGNTATGSFTITIKDTIPPTVTGTADRSPNGNGWYDSPVKITWNGTDSGSGILSCDAPTNYAGPDGTSIVLPGHCTDKAGNVGTGTVTIKYDSTPPTITGAKNPLPNANGWNKIPVTVTFTCNDNLSGVDTCSLPATVSTEGKNQNVTGTAIDNAGNVANFTVSGINIDKTPPTVSGTPSRLPDHNGWYNHPVVISWTGTDALSGIDSCDTATNYAGPDGTSITLTGHCTDKAGNVGTGTVTIKYDSTPPTLNVPANMTVFPTNPLGSTVSYTPATATDDETTSISCSPPSGSTFPFGPTPVSCVATDDAGNSAAGSFTITVLTPAQATSKLINIVNGMNLQNGETNSLDAKLQAALNSLNSNKNNAAENQLNAFINEVNAQTGKKISQAQAAQLLTDVSDIKNSIS